MGETPMRLAKVSERSWNGEKRALPIAKVYIGTPHPGSSQSHFWRCFFEQIQRVSVRCADMASWQVGGNGGDSCFVAGGWLIGFAYVF